uniref:Uncharacterized protein n=1 Tax=Sphaerodactylus townsendi TaxID=933632 RepID=A0ACB8FHE8_9SAUR
MMEESHHCHPRQEEKAWSQVTKSSEECQLAFVLQHIPMKENPSIQQCGVRPQNSLAPSVTPGDPAMPSNCRTMDVVVVQCSGFPSVASAELEVFFLDSLKEDLSSGFTWSAASLQPQPASTTQPSGILVNSGPLLSGREALPPGLEMVLDNFSHTI